ncbi:hypothetical protein AAVH_20505 [Aphelenchoides avenae]|nr:hypothetical protein AAVH_20505 [Aphelenchus avenae]
MVLDATAVSHADLVRPKAAKPLVAAGACNGCGKKAPAADMFTCNSCQETLNRKPLWFCSLCSMKQQRGHAMAECRKVTQQQTREACQGIASSGGWADMCIGLTTSHLNRALKETELIS